MLPALVMKVWWRRVEDQAAIGYFLQQHPPFNHLSAAQVEHIAAAIQVKPVTAGEYVFTSGSKPLAHLYIVRQGHIDLLREDGLSSMTVVDTFAEGGIFGHPSLIRRQPPILTAQARGRALLYLLPAAMFHQLCRDMPDIWEFFTLSAIERMGNAFHERQATTAPELFGTRLGDLEFHEVLTVPPETSVREAAQIMRDRYLSSLVVESTPLGIITDRDLRSRVLAAGISDSTPVVEVMSTPALTLSSDQLVFEALVLMLQRRIHHLPITENGQLVGMVTDTDILRRQSRSPLFLPDQLDRARTLDELRAYNDQVTATVGALLDAGARISDIGQVVAVANDALLIRVLRDIEQELGAPPCPYAWLVMGSEGRYEQTLRTDQDNALVYANDAPPEAEAYFAELAERVVALLETCGVPRCQGSIMATNPEWRQPLTVWESYFRHWIHLPEEEALLRVGIFFDYRQVYGTLEVESVLRPLIESGQRERIFLSRLARAALRQSPPIGFFRQFVVEQHGTARDLIDLKERGTALIVDLARLFALEAGSAVTNTLARLNIAAGRSSLSEKGAEELAAAFELISLLRLRHQYQQLQRGEEMTNQMPVSRLTKLEQEELRRAFRSVNSIQRSVEFSFQTARVG